MSVLYWTQPKLPHLNFNSCCKAFGTEGMALAENPRESHTVIDGTSGGATRRLFLSFPQRFEAPFAAELEHFLDCMDGRWRRNLMTFWWNHTFCTVAIWLKIKAIITYASKVPYIILLAATDQYFASALGQSGPGFNSWLQHGLIFLFCLLLCVYVFWSKNTFFVIKFLLQC